MMRYPIVIESGTDDTAFGVVFPDLPGCFSAGDTLDEAVSNAAEAAAVWIEDMIDHGQAVPKPSSLDAIRNNAEWSGWTVGFVTIDPAIFDETAERVNITLPKRVLARLDALAKEAGETRSGFIAKMAIHA
ncbi:type II toxin-antitoxin system HicB family antitoxin [Kozakia baliensis]|uniref:type II toxin-antitoxin system HicB family antitoxin n=1 Tax=Kozakia baliensis TaxID=153496 RepID=UPI00345C33B4